MRILIPEDSQNMVFGLDYTADEDGVVRFRTPAEKLVCKIVAGLIFVTLLGLLAFAATFFIAGPLTMLAL